MSINPHLKARLALAGTRQQRRRLWWKLAACWAGAAVVGVGWLGFAFESGWVSALAGPCLAVLAAVAALMLLRRQGGQEPDWAALAEEIERRNPELDGRLLTALQQEPRNRRELSFMQERLVRETLAQSDRGDWAAAVPQTGLRLAQAAHWLALLLLAATLWGLGATGGRRLLARNPDFGPASVTVTPGDATLERGESLVVLARFRGPLPANVELVLGLGGGGTRRIPLVKSLSDPLFGGSVRDVASNLVYHVEYGARRSRDFKVTVFEYPRLERADAAVTFPDYAAMPPKRYPNTRRLSAVEGSRLDLALLFNKPVASARLVAKDKERSVLPLAPGTNHAVAALSQFPLLASQTYELQLVDAEGRTNKAPAQFVFAVSPNRRPELRLTSPCGDLRPSPLEEIPFDGTVWDDFGVLAYGLGYTVAGKELQLLELGRAVPAQEKRSFHYLLRLEDLGVQPDQLVSWFVWADDVGPDGQSRRTTGDLFFGEVRRFEEVFREGSGMGAEGQGDSSGEQSGEPGEPGGRGGRLVELEKQIMLATWKLQREQKGAKEVQSPKPKVQTPKPETQAKLGNSTARNSPAPLVSNFAPLSFGFVSDFGPRTSDFHPLMGQAGAGAAGAEATAKRPARRPAAAPAEGPKSLDDLAVVLEAQAQALEQARAASEQQRDPRSVPLWSSAIKEMEQALTRLRAATNSPVVLSEALAAEQAAYQALLRLQEHEFEVSRRRSRNQRGNSAQQGRQQQLEQMDLTQSEDRYETQRQAQRPQTAQRREQLQTQNRLQELARRQQDLNDRLKELQTALQEARTEEERADIQRRLKRLQEEEQQMLGDVDELRQRMDRPENQSSMARERQQLEQTRQDVQRAAEAAGQGAASQALAAGSRAQEQLQQLRDQMRKENSNQFSDELREMRAQARDLARQQEDLQQRLEKEAASNNKSLSDSTQRRSALEQLARQRERVTNLVDRATQVSEQAEAPEPLLSRQLYDTVRRFTQTSAKDVQELEEQLASRGLMTRSLLDQLKSAAPDGAKLQDATSELLRQDFLPQANEVAQRARTSLEELKRGVEHAAESVLGDDTDALRLAQQELNRLTDELQKEMAQAEAGATSTNPAASTGALAGDQAPPNANRAASRENQGRPEAPPAGQQTTSAESGQRAGTTPREGASPAGQAGAQAREAARGERPAAQKTQAGGARGDAGRRAADTERTGGGAAPNVRRDLNTLLDERGWLRDGPITGNDFVSWADRLRDVEEMLEPPELRNEVARARERARVLRQAVKRDRQRPDWDVVRLQVVNPLTEVRDRIAEELARRQSREALVPIDRDPVPNRYSDLVRRYYEELGKEK